MTTSGEMSEVPEPGDKFKVDGKRGIYAFVRAVTNEDGVVWWDTIHVQSGRRHSFYPDELRPAVDKMHPKRKKSQPSPKGEHKMTVPDTLKSDDNEDDWEVITLSNGETIEMK